MADGLIQFQGPNGPSNLTFEIEQNPENDEMWGVWERVDSDPNADEIVATFPTEIAANEWIQRQLLDPETYLRSRGIVL